MKTGIAFGDFIQKEKLGRGRDSYQEGKSGFREFFLIFCLFLCLFFLFGRLFYLQVLQGDYYRGLSDSNRIRTVVIHAPRGVIFDRAGNPLVYNLPGFRKEKDNKTILLGEEQALSLMAKGEKDLEIDSLRFYPYKEVLSQVLGYIGQVSVDELKTPKFSDYKGGDLVGKAGIELEYEGKLKGVDGKQLVEVASSGNVERKLGQTDPISGRDLTLNIDLGLQKTLFDALDSVQKGAALVTTPNGEVLAMVSKPSFDPNLFTMGEAYKAASQSAYQSVSNILSDQVNQPLLNRVLEGLYPPGSTFKIVVAATGLEDQIIDSNYQVEDTGVINVGDFSFSNWFYTGYGRTDGLVNVVKGIQRSNDIFFYRLAEKIGPDKISEMAQKLKLDKKSGIDLPGEAKSLIPSTSWKEKTIGEPWFLGDTYHYGIGQGYVLATPLQVNLWTQVIANGGSLYKPHLLNDGKDPLLGKNLLSQSTTDLIRDGMIKACSPGGVAWPLFDFQVKNSKIKIDSKNFLSAPQASSSSEFSDYRQVVVACKTGTAQQGGEGEKPHAWITLFAPAYNPQIVATFLVEGSGEGANVAAPIAKKVLDYWFSR
jgi:penicillin-binding protein 2